MRKILFGCLIAAIFASSIPAWGDFLVQQPNGQWTIIKSYIDASGAQQQIVGTEGQKATYSFAIGPQTTFAATPNDIFVITGSATKTIRIGKLSLCGTATAATTAEFSLVKRSTAATGGTILNTATVVPNDSTNPAATATFVSYSVNPTPGTAVGVVDAKKLNLGALGAAGCLYWQWGDTNGQQIVLRGVAQQLSINFASATPPAGMSLDVKVELTEE